MESKNNNDSPFLKPIKECILQIEELRNEINELEVTLDHKRLKLNRILKLKENYDRMSDDYINELI